MKVGQIWKLKSGQWSVVNTLEPTHNIFFGFYKESERIYISEKRHNDMWVVFYLRNTKLHYDEGMESIKDIGIPTCFDEVWEEIKKANEENYEWFFIDDEDEPEDCVRKEISNGKFVISGDSIRGCFVLDKSSRVHITHKFRRIK